MAAMVKKPTNPITNLDLTDKKTTDDLDKLKDGIQSIISDYNYTPDMPELERNNFHYLFVYGTLKDGFYNNTLLENAEFMGVAFTSKDDYVMYNHKEFNYPIVSFTNISERKARIYGQVYKVPAWILRNVDGLEHNGVIYKRFKLKVKVTDYSQDHHQEITAWVYLGLKNFWQSKMDQLVDARRIIPNRKDSLPYFIFTKLDQGVHK